jgi:diguanylate cyclase (GGDEF)-like protein
MEHALAADVQLSVRRDEPARLEELRSYRILDTPAEGAFDDITRLASRYFDVPIAIVSLVDKDRVWFKSATGLGEVRQIGRGPGLCASAIMQDECYIARDLLQDPNSNKNPLVTKEGGFRFYAAAPLKTGSGHNIGTFCVIDLKPRPFSNSDAADLQRFASLAITRMDQFRAGHEVTVKQLQSAERRAVPAVKASPLRAGIAQGGAETILDELQSDIDFGLSCSIILVEVDHVQAINEGHGRHAGEFVLLEVSRLLKSMVRLSDFVVSHSSEGFLVVLRRCPPDIACDIAMRIRIAIRQMPVMIDGRYLTVSLSGGLSHSADAATAHEIMRAAEAAIQVAKTSGRDRIVVAEPLYA